MYVMEVIVACIMIFTLTCYISICFYDYKRERYILRTMQEEPSEEEIPIALNSDPI